VSILNKVRFRPGPRKLWRFLATAGNYFIGTGNNWADASLSRKWPGSACAFRGFVMSSQMLKLVKGLVIASAFAVITPAAAAGLVTAAAQGTMVVADATSPPSLRYASDIEAPVAGPARLSPLAGSDEMAWNNARSVGHIVRPTRKVR
jgi:hypothetical protein